MRKIYYIVCMISLLGLAWFPHNILLQLQTRKYEENISVRNSSQEAYANIHSIFTQKTSEFNTYGFFSQPYEASLQATYYGLFILDVLGKLDQINATQIINYIMSTYNLTAQIFMDSYSYRYLDTDFSGTFRYPLTSLLEVHCYGILSLDLLNALDMIDIEHSRSFIWSCYNPYTSGFIGEPFSHDLDYYAKLSTMDNTYYAVYTLNVLKENWGDYSQERDELVSYINALQITDNSTTDYGGFTNDNETFYFSLRLGTDVHIFASYYCLKTLKIFDMEDTINYDIFYEYLEELYRSDYFQAIAGPENPYANVVATALALDLANLTNFTSYNQSSTIEFLFTNKNSLGIWDGSTEIAYHELIDTFQIIHAFDDLDLTSMLTLTHIIEITRTILTYFLTSAGFTLISYDYTTISLLHTLISSYSINDRLTELDLQSLYQLFSNAYLLDDPLFHGFCGIGKVEKYAERFELFRSYPLEFHARGKKHYIDNIDYFISHKYTYLALDSLHTLFKLDDFGLTHNLYMLKDDIISTQFLDSSFPDCYGAFSYILPYGSLPPGLLTADIFFEYSYYAVRTLEILIEELNIGDLTFLDFNISALHSYITSHIIETSEHLYFNPLYTPTIETILQNTYYMVYVLKALDLYDLSTQKLIAYLESHIDYSNIKNIYYCYKLSEVLDYEFVFNVPLIQQLVIDIYDDENSRFYLTPDHEILDTETFLWICEMAKTEPEIVATYPSECTMGTEISISASLSNLILSYFGANLSFIIESDQLGTYEFTPIDVCEYNIRILIPHESDNYPTVNGKIKAFFSGTQITEISISISTQYPRQKSQNTTSGTLILSALFITLPGGIIIVSEKKLRKKKLKL